MTNVNTIPCDFYEICGTATYAKDSEMEFYEDGYVCAECFDQMDMFINGWELA